MAADNSGNGWLAKTILGFTLFALFALSMAMWSASADTAKEIRSDIKTIEQRIDERLETKESHNKDIEHIKETFTFITQQLKEIKEAVKR